MINRDKVKTLVLSLSYLFSCILELRDPKGWRDREEVMKESKEAVEKLTDAIVGLDTEEEGEEGGNS